MLRWLWRVLRGSRGGLIQGLDVLEGVFRPTASAARHELGTQHEIRVEAPSPDDAFFGDRAISINRSSLRRREGTAPGEPTSN